MWKPPCIYLYCLTDHEREHTCTLAQWLICFTAGGDRANFTQIHHQNFDISFLGVKLHYILGGIQMDLCLQVPSTRNAKQSCLGGRLKNRVKMVPRLLSLKLMLMYRLKPRLFAFKNLFFLQNLLYFGLGSTYNNPIYVKLTEIISAFTQTLKI